MTRAASPIVRRMRALASLEVFNAALIPFVLLAVLDMPASPANLTGMALVVLFLVEGGAYWELKHRQLAAGRPPAAGLGMFRVLRPVNAALLAAGLAFVTACLLGGDAGWRAWPGAGLWLFAAAEHVNYFHVQLMHDTRADIRRLLRTRRLRRAHLARDLDRTRRRQGRP